MYEGIMRKANVYNDLEISRNQIASGQTKDARKAIKSIKKKYGINLLDTNANEILEWLEV